MDKRPIFHLKVPVLGLVFSEQLWH